MLKKYEVGERCWIKIHGRDKPLQSRVAVVFNIPTQSTDFYIIQVVEGHYAYLEVRDALLMSPVYDEKIPQISYIHQGTTSLKHPSEMN